MEALTYSYTRTHLAQVMRSVNEDRAPVLVTTQRVQPRGQVFHSLTGSAIHLPPVANLQDQHTHHAILDAADDAVFVDPVSP